MIERIQPLGDMGICLSFGKVISKEVNDNVRRFHLFIKREQLRGVIESVPAYTSLAIYYEPWSITYDRLVCKLTEMQQCIAEVKLPPAKTIEMPVLYGGEVGPDLEFVANYHRLTIEEVIERHVAPEYLIYMMGFMPGFPYLGGMDERIATPRLENPRAKVAPGSVGIAGSQTGIYPLQSPGGWQIIGRTPVKLYDPHAEEPLLLSMGDSIKFVSITEAEYEEVMRGEDAL